MPTVPFFLPKLVIANGSRFLYAGHYLTIFHNESHGVSYSKKLHGKPSFPNLANCRNSQFMFSKYLEYQNVKLDSGVKM